MLLALTQGTPPVVLTTTAKSISLPGVLSCFSSILSIAETPGPLNISWCGACPQEYKKPIHYWQPSECQYILLNANYCFVSPYYFVMKDLWTHRINCSHLQNVTTSVWQDDLAVLSGQNVLNRLCPLNWTTDYKHLLGGVSPKEKLPQWRCINEGQFTPASYLNLYSVLRTKFDQFLIDFQNAHIIHISSLIKTCSD